MSKGALCHSHVIPSPEFQTLEDSLGSGHCVLGDGKGSLPQLRPLPQLLQQQRGWDDKRYMMTHPQSSAMSGLWSSFLSRTMPGSTQMAALPGKPPQPWAGPETYPLSATCSLWYPKSPVTLLGLYSGNPICTPTHTPDLELPEAPSRVTHGPGPKECLWGWVFSKTAVLSLPMPPLHIRAPGFWSQLSLSSSDLLCPS